MSSSVSPAESLSQTVVLGEPPHTHQLTDFPDGVLGDSPHTNLFSPLEKGLTGPSTTETSQVYTGESAEAQTLTQRTSASCHRGRAGSAIFCALLQSLLLAGGVLSAQPQLQAQSETPESQLRRGE